MLKAIFVTGNALLTIGSTIALVKKTIYFVKLVKKHNVTKYVWRKP